MEIFDGTPRDKFYDVLFNANRNLVEDELDNLLNSFSLMSEFCELNGFDVWANLNVTEIRDLSDLYIELTSNILSKNE
ncbi:DUF2018 family protein [Campylobacter corcagiensis]|uniref:DUF2018 family protein n=1 Tax=Campylobacter corcagiensis TaxID=1448857 RepID=UPI0004BCE6A6|nr:DUF2018 family protein [Campylobacter corcagiensis]QKF64481.1 DUF2018 domain-containing protein [Campylobacter corcagiensis]